ncbi:MAG: MFS transporter [Chloroflexota bacterium]|nr:MFS transporter [Chloroflexota bacterium]
MKPSGLNAANSALLLLMFGHFTNDMLSGVLPMLYPTMKAHFELDNAQIGLATLAYTTAASLTQPVFGYCSDRFAQRWFAPATLVWGGFFVSVYGFANSYVQFLSIAALAGIGSGAFHPLGAANAAAITPDRVRNSALSFYTVGGSVGFALGPLVAVALLAWFGPKGTIVLILPALAAATLIFSRMRGVEAARNKQTLDRDLVEGITPEPAQWRHLGKVMGVVMLRSWVFLSVLQYVPVLYDDLGFRPAFYGAVATAIILGGAAGTLIGGALADRVGQRLVIVGSMVLVIPSLLLFAGFPGAWAIATGMLFGLLCDASLSVTLVTAQRLMPGRVGMASGLILGLGFVTGGIGVPITGLLADALGFRFALMALTLLAGVSALIGLTLPDRERARLNAQPDRPNTSAESIGIVE